MDTTMRQWVDRFAAETGVEPPDDATVDRLLTLAGVAAHASERTAAPITCYLVAQSGITLDRAHEVAGAIAAELAAEP